MVISRRLLCVFVALLGAVLAGCKPQTSDSGATSAAQEVGVVTLRMQALAQRTQLAGRVVAAQSAEVRPQVTGVVQARLFTEGSRVAAGQPLFQLDARLFDAAVRSAEAQLARAKAAQGAAALRARRQAELLPLDATSRQDADDAAAQAAQAGADVQAAEAALTTARTNLALTRITAPIAGRVDTAAVPVGALVTANQTAALVTVQQLDPVFVDIPQSSAELLRLRSLPGVVDGPVTVQLQLEDASRYPHAGQLTVRGLAVDPASGAVMLRARVPNPDGVLLPGMFVSAEITHGAPQPALLVPQSAVARNPRGEASAWVVVGAAGSERAQRRSVVLGAAQGNQWQVTSGLATGDRVVVEGSGKIKDGQAVRAVPAGAARAAASSASGAATAAATAAASGH